MKPLDYHLDIGARLAPLRDKGIAILGSGNIVLNLRRVQWNKPDAAFDWAERFDDAVAEQLADEPGAIVEVAEHPDYDLAVPTPGHFVPMPYLVGLAAEEKTVRAVSRGYAMGSISMSCYGLGTDIRIQENPTGAAEHPADVPPDQTNA